MVQRVRFLEWHENEGAGQVWKSFCKIHNAETTKGAAPFINMKYVKTIGNPVSNVNRGRDGITSTRNFFTYPFPASLANNNNPPP